MTGSHSSREIFELEGCEILAETANAIKVSTEGIDEVWIPLSQVEKIERQQLKFASRVRMTSWIAKKKGLI